MEPLSSFSLGLDPRVHTIPATPHGCPDQVRAKRGEGLESSQTLTLSLSKGEGLGHRTCRHPSTGSG